MSPRAAVKRRRRRRRTSAQIAGSNGAGSLLSQVTALVAENQALARQNRDLQASLETISRAVQGISPGAPRRRRGRVAQAASARPVGRPRRRRAMSPETLAKRRAGLAKARAVLAAKRAAAKRKK